jgi:hypothetical protein
VILPRVDAVIKLSVNDSAMSQSDIRATRGRSDRGYWTGDAHPDDCAKFGDEPKESPNVLRTGERQHLRVTRRDQHAK